MRLAWLRSSAIPVQSHRRDGIVARPPVPVPDVGARWGRPSAFIFSRERRQQEAGPGVTVDLPEDGPQHYMRIIPATLQVRSETVEVTAGDGSKVRIDRMTRIAFHFTELVPKPSPAWPQTARTTWYDLTFELQPGPEAEA